MQPQMTEQFCAHRWFRCQELMTGTVSLSHYCK